METVTCITNKCGSKFYFNNNGELHNENGPAIVWDSGTLEWHLNGQKVTKIEFLKHALYATVRQYYNLLVTRSTNLLK